MSKIGGQEIFVPLSHSPGEAQAYFGEAMVVIAGVECKAHFMAFDLPYSDDCFVQAFPAETTEAFLEGHVRAFDYFGGVPTRIVCGVELIARHQRSYAHETAVYDPLHYLALLEHKSRALDQAAPLAGWQLPKCFADLQRLLEARLNKHAGREYIPVLRLLETFALEEVTRAIEDALRLNTISFDAVRHLVLCRIECPIISRPNSVRER
jgi:hypothetical protein